MHAPDRSARGTVAGMARRGLAGVAMTLACSASAAENAIVINPCVAVAANIPDMAQCTSGGRFRLSAAEGAPKGAAFFFVRYAFRVETKGLYSLVVESPNPGTSRSSRFSVSFDGGSDFAVLRRQRVEVQTLTGLWHQEQDPVELSAGEHTLEFRFRPEDRMREMNRVGAPYVGHRIEITGLQVRPAAPVATERPLRSEKRKLQVSGGDQVVLFGDSITEEEFYGKHLVRLLDAMVADGPVRVYNSGVALNRTWEALERLDRDVLALRPQWAALAFGVNDCVHMAPEEFARNYEQLVRRLTKAGIRVVCATPSGMCSAPIHSGQWFHTPDRANGFDRTCAYESGAILRIAEGTGCPVADVYGAFTRSGFDRAALMANQWHPNDDGGRIFALAILQALGTTADDVAKSGDPKDLAMWQALAAMPPAAYPEFGVKAFARPATNTGAIVASSFSRNAVYAFDDAGRPLACVSVGHHPMGLAWNATLRELYVACEGSGRIEVIGFPDFRLKDPIVLGDVYPIALALSEDGRTLWSVNFFGSSLSEIDLGSRKVRRTIPLGAIGTGLFAPSGGKPLVAVAGEEAVFVDPVSAAVLKRVKVSANPGSFFVDAQGRPAIVDTGRWTLSAVDPVAMSVAPAGEAPYRARALFSVDGGGVLAGDCERGRVVRRFPGRPAPEDVAEVEFPLGLCRIPIDGDRQGTP